VSFTYQMWLSPWLYERIYLEMHKHDDATVKAAIKRILHDGAKDGAIVARAIALAQLREGVRSGSHPVLDSD